MSSSIPIPASAVRKSARQSSTRKTSATATTISSSSSLSLSSHPTSTPSTSAAVPSHHSPVMATPTTLARSAASQTPSSSASSSLFSPSTPPTATAIATKDKGKGKMIVTPEQIAEEERLRWAASPFRRRPSLMGKELEATKHIVVDVGAPDAPRLISCVASSQGFDWNSSIFLPRYLTGRYVDEQLEHRQDPIEDIFVTDEEAREIFPQWT